mgnify:CR=1 FL=1
MHLCGLHTSSSTPTAQPGCPVALSLPLQGKSTAKQVHADLKMRYEAEHMGPPKVAMPYPDLLDILEYRTAYDAACAASEPVKGERLDRDPQVGAETHIGHRPACLVFR